MGSGNWTKEILCVMRVREKMCVWYENGARERMCELRVVQENVWGVRGCVG